MRSQAHGLRFDHNLHALRIVTWFEERYAGLSRTQSDPGGPRRHRQTLARLLRRRSSRAGRIFSRSQFPPLEAQLIDLADEIAYLTADLDDGLDSGILILDQVREAVPLFRRFHDAVAAQYPACARPSSSSTKRCAAF